MKQMKGRDRRASATNGGKSLVELWRGVEKNGHDTVHWTNLTAQALEYDSVLHLST